MNIGVIITYRANTDIEKEFQKMTSLNINSCQLSIWDMNLYSDETAKLVLAAEKNTGIKISALWAGWTGPREWNFYQGPATLGIVPPAYRFQRLNELFLASNFAEKIAVTDIISHVGFLPENPLDPDFNATVAALRSLTKYMKTKGQYFLFETGQETPVTLLRTIEEIGMDNSGVNFDTANLIMYGKANSVDALDVIGKYVRNLHIKDGLYPTCGKELGKEVPFGEGKANFPALLRKLKSLNYSGPYTIEREISGDEQIKDIILARDGIIKILNDI